MKLGALAFGAIVAMALTGAASAFASPTATAPDPSATSNVTVTIPGTATPTPTSTTSPTPRPSSSGGSGSGSNGGGEEVPTLPVDCAQTDPDGTPIAPKTPSEPSADATRATFDPDRSTPGGRVTATADGFDAGERVEAIIYAEGESLGSFVAEPDGTITAHLRLPADTAIGDHSISLLGWVSCATAAGDILVESKAGSGASIFPWVVWVIVGSAVLVAAILLILAISLGWLRFASVRTTPGVTNE